MNQATSRRQLGMLSVVIPARDEEGCIASTVQHVHLELRLKNIPHEIIVVDDGSTDRTGEILAEVARELPELKPVRNDGPHGFGRAIQKGLSVFSGDAVVIMMADESDDCRDVVRYWQELNNGVDCVFGSRFLAGGGVIDYPRVKYALNRMANLFIRILFQHGLNDTTNAFKAYRREVIEGCQPILSPHFNITVELPLKAIVRGYTWSVIPITWRNRRTGVAKLKIREMGSRYFFIVAYVWLEKYFSRGDYRREQAARHGVGGANGEIPSPPGGATTTGGGDTTSAAGTDTRMVASSMSAFGEAEAASRFRSWWPFVVALLCLVGITLATICRWPLVWCDEPYFVAPAWHLAHDGVFASEISDRRPRDVVPPEPRIWTGNCPLYSMILGYWLKCCGFSLFSARSLNVVLYAIAVVVVAIAMRRLGLLGSTFTQLLFPFLMFSCYGLVFEYRQCRYDVLCILECALLFLATTIRATGVRHGLMLAVAWAVSWSGFPTVAWLAPLFAMHFILFGRRGFWDGVYVAAGLVLGLLSLFAWLHVHDSVSLFLGHVMTVQDRVPFSVMSRIKLLLSSLTEDRARVALWMAAMFLLTVQAFRGRLTWRSPLVVVTASVLVGSIVMVAVTSRVYVWMISIPLIIGLVSEFNRKGEDGLPWPATVIGGCLVALAGMGLPSVLLASAYEWQERDPRRVDEFIAANISPGDCAFCDITAFFPVRQTAKRVIVEFGTWKTEGVWDDVEREVEAKTPHTVMVIRPDRAERTIREFGGGWHEVARLDKAAPTWPKGSLVRLVLEKVVDFLYPPPLDPDSKKRIATDRVYELVVLRPIGHSP